MDGPGISGAHGQKKLRSHTFPSHIRPGVPRIFLTAPLSYAAIGLPHDRGEKLLATENSQPVTGDKYFSFWPIFGEEEKEKDINFFDSVPAKFHSITEDEDEKRFKADESIEIKNLEEVSMLNFWKTVMTERIYYNLLRMNCCVTVALSLRVGFLNSSASSAALAKLTGFSLSRIKQKAELQTFLKKTELDGHGNLIEGPPMSPRVVAYYARLLRRVMG